VESGAARVRDGGPDVEALTVVRGLGQVVGEVVVDRVVAGHGEATGACPAPPALVVVMRLMRLEWLWAGLLLRSDVVGPLVLEVS
jgi:hypothetical protein